MPDPASTPSTLLTPTRGGRRSSATTPGTTGRGRSRRRSSSRTADGYDSTGAGAFSDGEGLPPLPSPQPLQKLPLPPMPSAGSLRSKLSSPVAGLTLTTVTATTETGLAVADGTVPADTMPASPTTGVRRRSSRPRKSLRFAPGTVSPGAHAAAAAAAASAAGSLSGELVATSPVPSLYLTSPLSSPRISDAGMAAAAAAHGASKPGYSSAPPRLSLERLLRNTLLIFLVMLPSIYFYRQLHFGCREEQHTRPLADVWRSDLAALATADFWCAVGYQQPLLAVNLVFLLNVGILFWFISLLQGSTWLIDPFWTIIPPMIGLFYQYHPAATTQPLRSRLAMGLLWVWAVRLTHSYFRREEWQVGAREDWRYARMAQRLGRLRWALASFFAVGVTQQLMLVGITLPLLAIHTSPVPWNPLADTAIFLGAATGIMVALIADNQLRDFMLENEKRAAEGRSKLLLLDTGLWRYSRHPNFFGEQLWWWSLGMWAVLCGQPWMLLGAAFNTLCFIPITLMTEQRMLERAERASLYRHYQRTTSVWVPWPKRVVVA